MPLCQSPSDGRSGTVVPIMHPTVGKRVVFGLPGQDLVLQALHNLILRGSDLPKVGGGWPFQRRSRHHDLLSQSR